ncbi:hypothetical protein PIROE2DRAFT_57658 [Piromyces sp. E2]|nr:hypothetical protein PIROE2DRAFT_57658 [Piromyces sp. E2]|eukprot:OUM69015.1 hypothetical protein PIROE2DRAFT_57658 [Piromyces sp. E2]
MNKNSIINCIFIIVLTIVAGVKSQLSEQESLKKLFTDLKLNNQYFNILNEINQGTFITNELIEYQNNSVVKLDLSDNNITGDRKYYGQLPKCLSELNKLEEFNISNNKFRGQLPKLNAKSLNKCNLNGNELCLFHQDTIPIACLNFESLKEQKKNIDFKTENMFYKKNNINLCKNIFVSRNNTDNADKTGKMFTINNKNTDKEIIIYSGIFPVVSLIITVGATIYGRIKSKFNRKDNITTFTASISHLPNNSGSNSNANNRHSLTTKFDSYIRPAPRPDNENSSIYNTDQKRISSNPSTSGANTSVSSITPQSPTILPNEIKYSNYRAIGSHYSLNPSQAIRFKNSLSMIQNNRNSITNGSDIDNAHVTTQSTNDILTSVSNQKENNNDMDNLAVSTPEVSKNNGSSTPSKALESLDMLLSSPQAMYYREKISPSIKPGMKSPKPMSPIQLPKMNPYSPSINLYSKGPLNKDKSPVLINNPSIGGYPVITSSPSMSVPKYISPYNKTSQNLGVPNPYLFKQNSPQSPNIKKPRVRRVVYSFIADLPDELQLTPGQEVIIHKVFDDGYAYGENASNGQLGVFPITSLHPDDQDITVEEMESSPSLNDIQFSQLSMNKSPNMMSPLINKPLSPSKFNNFKIQEKSPSLVINKNSQDILIDNLGKPINTNNLYPVNSNQNSNSQNSNSQNSNSQNSLTDEDDIDSLRRQSKIPYSAFMDQQKQKLIKKQAKQAKKNKMASLNNYYNNNEQEFYKEPPFSPTYLSQNMILNENINNRMFSSQQSQNSQLSNDVASSSASPYSPQYRNMTNILNSMKSESPSALEMQRMEDRRYKQIKLLNERLSKKDIGPEEKRYYLQLLQQLTN